jgi:hypothetical protein
MPKVARSMLPHIQINEGITFTAAEMAALMWDAQAERDDAAIAEAEAQQRRALERHVAEALAVFVGLGFVTMGARGDTG